MANMSYCRFENTYRDLVDCYRNLNNELSDRENQYREMLVQICNSIVEEYEFVKMGEGDDDWDEPEYDSAGFTEEDRIVNGQYMNVENNNNPSNNDEVSWDTQTK